MKEEILRLLQGTIPGVTLLGLEGGGMRNLDLISLSLIFFCFLYAVSVGEEMSQLDGVNYHSSVMLVNNFRNGRESRVIHQSKHWSVLKFLVAYSF